MSCLLPLILSLSKDEFPGRGGWFDRLTMSGFCSWRLLYPAPRYSGSKAVMAGMGVMQSGLSWAVELTRGDTG